MLRFVAVCALVACSEPTPVAGIVPSPATDAALRDFAALTPGVTIGPGDVTITVVDDDVCAQCYRITAAAHGWDVHAGDVLGAQYGVAEVLEDLGYRFRTPTDTYVPDQLAFAGTLDILHTPAIAGERGLQLHTLHPIEAQFALWQPGDELDARRIFDWIVKNRGNHVQWPALDDIMESARHAEWQAMTARYLELAHARGLTVGLGVQIFGSGNMQHAFDLSDGADFDGELAARLPLVTTLPFDAYVLAFGEFQGEDPERFIAAVDATTAAIHAARPAATVHASIHLGADQRVSYRGEELPYYFLVKYADPSIVSNVHTVMFYNLFEDAGGAYGYRDFTEHREYLFDQMRRGRRAEYYPESAYWIAFDNSVPLFLPLYVRSRWLDLDGIAARARDEGLPGLDGHLVFSSGWEWGYWLTDVTSLRASYELPASPRDLIAEALGKDLAPAVDVVSELADVEAAYSIDGRLAPYLAGRDALIDLGDMLGVHSQPDRVTFDDLVAADGATRSQFAQTVVDLASYSTELAALARRAAALDLPESRWSRELLDGFTVTAARARFVAAAYAAVLAHLDGLDTTTLRREMDASLADGHRAVAHRHADLHWPRAAELTGRPTANATAYNYGYLFQADSLCYWERERAQVAAILDGATGPIPNCFL